MNADLLLNLSYGSTAGTSQEYDNTITFCCCAYDGALDFDALTATLVPACFLPLHYYNCLLYTSDAADE